MTATRQRLAGLAAAVAATAVLGAGLANASPHSGVDSQLYRPSFDAMGLLSLDSARSMQKYDFSLKLNLGYAQNLMSMPVPGIGSEDDADTTLRFALNLNLNMAFAFTERLSLGFDVGMARVDTDDGFGTRGLFRPLPAGPEPSTGLISTRPVSNIDPSGGIADEGLVAPTDVRIGLKYQVIDGRKFDLAVLGIASVPFGEDETFIGDDGFVLEPRVAADFAFGSNRVNRFIFNVSARLRNRTVLQVIEVSGLDNETPRAVLDVGSEISAGAGIIYELLPRVIVSAEAVAFVPLPDALSGSCQLVDGRDCDDLMDEEFFDSNGGDFAAYAMGGMRVVATDDTSFELAGGTAALGGDGRNNDFRFLAGVTWRPVPEGARALARGDRDGDGVNDSLDICPDEPEDEDGYDDEDGCPDLDNDGDGVIDAQDQCSDQPEDRDGFQDEDGCPEADNDGDGVNDVVDRCINEVEDRDGFEDTDGCPDEDNDGDGIADKNDVCPNDPETINKYQDTDGCPDDVAVMSVAEIDPVTGDINVTQQIKFGGARSTRLTAADKKVLDEVAQTMKRVNNRYRVDVYVAQSTRSTNRRQIRRARTKDQALSDRRARAVARYLESKGVTTAGNNLQPTGLGSSRPLKDFTPYNEAQNRVVFTATQVSTNPGGRR